MTTQMRKTVEDGYEKGEYAKVFRSSAELNQFEQEFFNRLLQRLPPDPNILDLGSGTGIPYDKFLVDKGCRVTGVDLCQKHIAEAIKNVPEAVYLKGDFSRLELEEKSFDAIISLYAIFHLPRIEHPGLFQKLNRLLKSGGLIMVSLGTSDSEYGEEDDWCGARMAWSTYDPPTYEKMITGAGFTILKSAFEGQPGDEEYHFWVLAVKS